MTATHLFPIIAETEDAARAFAGLGRDGIEHAAVLYLDPERRLLGRADFTGSRGSVTPSLRAVIAGALSADADALILGHGHPSGSATPSVADIAYTRRLASVCMALDVELLDHLILTRDTVTSLRRLGML